MTEHRLNETDLKHAKWINRMTWSVR